MKSFFPFFGVVKIQYSILLEKSVTKMKKWLPLFPLILLIQNLSCDEISKKILKIYKPNYETEQKILQSKPIFNGADENRNKIAIS